MSIVFECICADKGHCTLHNMVKGAREYQICKGINVTEAVRENYVSKWQENSGGSVQALALPKPSSSDTSCPHRGAVLRVGACDLCGVRGQPFEVLSCAVHGECSLRRKHSKVKTCLTCKDNPNNVQVKKPRVTPKKASAPRAETGSDSLSTGPNVEHVDLHNAVRHLTFHIYPVSGYRTWQWNCDTLLQNADLFNGRRIVGIVTDETTDDVDVVREYLKNFTDEFVVLPNESSKRECVTWLPMVSELEKYRSTLDVTFSAHAKGVRHRLSLDDTGTTLFRWTQAMWDTCLTWDKVQPLLETFGTVGTFRRFQSHRRGGFGPWHYSGAFYWWRNLDAFSRKWTYLPERFFGTEAWPGWIFNKSESGVLLLDKVKDLYILSYWEQEVEPVLQKWRSQLCPNNHP